MVCFRVSVVTVDRQMWHKIGWTECGNDSVMRSIDCREISDKIFPTLQSPEECNCQWRKKGQEDEEINYSQ